MQDYTPKKIELWDVYKLRKRCINQPLPCKKITMKFVIFFSTNNFFYIIFLFFGDYFCFFIQFMRIHIFQFFKD